MRVAKLAFLTTPAHGVFIINLQVGDDELQRFEISKAHLTNILIDGASVALREYSGASNTLKLNPANEAYNVERAER